MMEAGNHPTTYETDAQPDGAPEQIETQHIDGPDAVIDDSKATISIANPSEVSQGDKPLSAPSLVESNEAAALARLEELLTEGLAKILKEFQVKLAFDKFKEDQITRLHDELQGYKADLLAKACRPLVSGVIRLHDDVGKMTNALRKQDPAALSPEKFFKVIEGFQQDIEMILDQNGIEAYRESGGKFEPRRQKALVTIPTTDSSSIGSVAERLYPGFEQGGFIFQKERVAVYVPAKAIDPPPDNDGNGPSAASLATANEGEEK